tara:strand:- start:3422 stop:3994 length:573 start_codon:yes stop_codon:yes gene_type:complete
MLGVDNLMLNEKADFIYSDPPWGQGNLKYWQTMNVKMNDGIRNDPDYNNFINNFFNIISKFSKDKILIEYGERWREDIINMCIKYNLIHNEVVTSYYKAGAKMLPLDFHFISKKQKYDLNDDIRNKVATLSGQKVVHAVFDFWCPKDSKIILDPMCGMGYTAQATVDRNMSFRGNELNKKRLDKTIKRLQ